MSLKSSDCSEGGGGGTRKFEFPVTFHFHSLIVLRTCVLLWQTFNHIPSPVGEEEGEDRDSGLYWRRRQQTWHIGVNIHSLNPNCLYRPFLGLLLLVPGLSFCISGPLLDSLQSLSRVLVMFPLIITPLPHFLQLLFLALRLIHRRLLLPRLSLTLLDESLK